MLPLDHSGGLSNAYEVQVFLGTIYSTWLKFLHVIYEGFAHDLTQGFFINGLNKYIGWIKVLATLLSHDDRKFESCQLYGHEQRLLDELVHPAATVISQSTAVCRTLTFIGIV